MLRKRSRAVTSKQTLMADHGSLQSPTNKYIKPTSSFFNSPRLLRAFSSKGFSETEAVMSPTSILDCKPFSVLGNPILSEKNSTKSPETCVDNNIRHPRENLDSKGVGLGIVDALNDERKTILFGSQLKIQIPHLPSSTTSLIESPESPTDFGINTRNSQLGFLSPGLSPWTANKSASGSLNSGHSGGETLSSPRGFTGCLSATEMELSEDYTCVISHGPNPKTTHIFDNCIVESCCGVVGLSASKKADYFFSDRPGYRSENFLRFCYTCKKDLGQGKDIYMYRGEKAFCSRECRYQEMLFDEESESEDARKICS